MFALIASLLFNSVAAIGMQPGSGYDPGLRFEL